MNKDQSNIVLGTATPDIDLAPTSSEQTLNFWCVDGTNWSGYARNTRQLRRMRPTYWIINTLLWRRHRCLSSNIFIRYGHREYLSTLFTLSGHGDALRIGGQLIWMINQCATHWYFIIIKEKELLLPVNILLALRWITTKSVMGKNQLAKKDKNHSMHQWFTGR